MQSYEPHDSILRYVMGFDRNSSAAFRDTISRQSIELESGRVALQDEMLVREEFPFDNVAARERMRLWKCSVDASGPKQFRIAFRRHGSVEAKSHVDAPLKKHRELFLRRTFQSSIATSG